MEEIELTEIIPEVVIKKRGRKPKPKPTENIVKHAVGRPKKYANLEEARLANMNNSKCNYKKHSLMEIKKMFNEMFEEKLKELKQQ